MGRHAQPPPRQPEPRGSRPGHRRRRTRLHRRAGRKAQRPVSRFIARRQAWLFFPLLTLEGISLHVDSVIAVKTGEYRARAAAPAASEAIGLAVHAVLYVGLLLLVMSPEKALAFVTVHQAVWGVYMGCTFAPNHKGMPPSPPTRTSTTCGGRCSPHATSGAACSPTSCSAG